MYGPLMDDPTAYAELEHRSLLDLTLHIYHPDGRFKLNTILFATPRLRRLRLNLQCMKNGASGLPSLLTEHCPNLTTLVLASCDTGAALVSHGNDLEWNFDTSTSITDNNSDPKNTAITKIRHLVLHDPLGIYFKIICDILRRLIPLCHYTLQTLDLVGTHTLHGSITMTWLSKDCTFRSLQRLSLARDRIKNMITFNDFDFEAFAESGSASGLKSLKLQRLDSDFLKIVSLAAHMQSLRELHFEDCPQISSKTLTAFFSELSVAQTGQIQQQKQLVKVTLRDMQWVDSRVVHDILDDFGVGLEELVIQECDYVDFDVVKHLCLDDDLPVDKNAQHLKRLDLILVYHNPMYFCPSQPSRKIIVYPDSNRIQKALYKLDAECLEWRLELNDFTQHGWEPYAQVFDHNTYRQHKVASSIKTMK
ncbi:hypothetical protein BDB00DRAFT_132747 [Zychaea mexicana]|uniref:uncharacterized protein n=1 Tax=Zychaea mexicana TaxID=64656 RepID=UPI0022FE4BF6|nr:uncharacterized protein BDB00DRAFT_132747 [Zychaea mexicana]KAI9484520.1 hypothetical protein BDB00DRAFT_132747 [Zychaea mexicana]